MRSPLRFPIRLKILITLLFVVTGVVSAITFTMANLFHEDKKAYINDLVSMVAISTAEESRSILVGYQERLQVYSRILGDTNLERQAKTQLLEGFFYDFPELVAITVEDRQEELAAAYNGALLEPANLSREDLVRNRADHPLPFDEIVSGSIHVVNSTISRDLPTLTMAVPQTRADGSPVVVSAVIRLENLLRVALRSKSFEVFLAQEDGTLLAHPDRERVARRDRIALQSDVLAVAGQFNAGVTREYVDDAVEMIGGFAGVSFGRLISGAKVQKSAAFLASRDLLGNLVTMALGLLLLSALAGLFWAHRLTRPVEKLSEATREIAKGEFEIQVQVESRDEIGDLASSFNQMACELKERDSALDEAQAQLVQSEKMAAFGQLGAGIAHEVKNPLAGILGCAQLSLRKVDKETPLGKNLVLIEKETRRCKAIIENLLRFARREKAALEPIHVNPVVNDAVAIVGHQLGMAKVQIETELTEDLPQIHGNSNQLQQVLMNLMMNAQQAMEGEPGTVWLATRLTESGHVQVVVSDSGPGISKEVQERLFEPFFTTKPGGKGTGLGLSVSFGIIKDHGGEITVESSPGNGATFAITLPLLQEHRPEAYVTAQGA